MTISATYTFTCDACGKLEILTQAGNWKPPGWLNLRSSNTRNVETTYDICPDCTKKWRKAVGIDE
jgi:predicted RNA-binding Zn-ribbon protein involved in translation (DUF1610 family)